MSLPEAYPDQDELLVSISGAGGRPRGIEASEGATGLISRYSSCSAENRRRSCNSPRASGSCPSSCRGRPR
jgi:hypothetical protein